MPDRPLIDDLDLVVEPGQTVAIVGPTGAGKTTVVNLLMRFYEIDGGRISIDGVDTRDLTRDDLRRTFGMVLQDTWLFGGTIRDNIAYGREGATEAEIVAAAEAAHVDHFVRTLPDGYDTVVDDDATNLSAGEKQLLTIARAFLADPPILILDEATSSVDTRTEVLIQRAMARLHGGSDDVRHRPPALDHPRRRHDPRHGPGPHRRAGQPRRAARGAAASTPTCTRASSPRPSKSVLAMAARCAAVGRGRRDSGRGRRFRAAVWRGSGAVRRRFRAAERRRSMGAVRSGDTRRARRGHMADRRLS